MIRDGSIASHVHTQASTCTGAQTPPQLTMLYTCGHRPRPAGEPPRMGCTFPTTSSTSRFYQRSVLALPLPLGPSPCHTQTRAQPWTSPGNPSANSDDSLFATAAQHLVPGHFTLMTGVAFETGIFDASAVYLLYNFDQGEKPTLRGLPSSPCILGDCQRRCTLLAVVICTCAAGELNASMDSTASA